MPQRDSLPVRAQSTRTDSTKLIPNQKQFSDIERKIEDNHLEASFHHSKLRNCSICSIFMSLVCVVTTTIFIYLSWNSNNQTGSGLPVGTILAWRPPNNSSVPPKGWAFCNGSEQKCGDWERTPNLTNTFLIGSGKEEEKIWASGVRSVICLHNNKSTCDAGENLNTYPVPYIIKCE